MKKPTRLFATHRRGAPAQNGQDNFATGAFFSFFIWGVCSALAITVCTLVDALLVGNLVGSEGLAVENLATPVFLIYVLLGITLGVGGSVCIGKQLGGGDTATAQMLFHKLMWLGALVGVVCMVVCVSMQTLMCRLLGVQDALMSMALAYLTPVFYAAPLFIIYHVLSFAVRIDGNPKCAAVAAAVVILTNLSFDLLFMKQFGMGLRGASLSLFIAETLGVAVLLTHFLRKKRLLSLRFVRPSWGEAYAFVANGFGVGSALLCQGIVMICFNVLLLQDAAQGVFYVAVFGIIYNVSLLPGAFFEGMSGALATVLSIFCGEKDKDGVVKIFRHAVVLAVALGVFFAAGLFCFAPQIFAVFALAENATANLALRLFTASLLLTGVHVAVTAFWQAIGRARLAAVWAMLRNFVLMLSVGAVLIPRYQIVGLALTYLVVECICLVVACAVALLRGSVNYLTERYQTVQRTYEKCYPIETESMAQIATDLAQICEEWGMSMRQSFFVNLMVEELVLNIMKFGLVHRRKKHYVAIKLLDNDGDYILRIRDNVKAYNPFDSEGDEVDAGALRLITTKAQYYDYQRKLIFNYLYLII